MVKCEKCGGELTKANTIFMGSCPSCGKDLAFKNFLELEGKLKESAEGITILDYIKRDFPDAVMYDDGYLFFNGHVVVRIEYGKGEGSTVGWYTSVLAESHGTNPDVMKPKNKPCIFVVTGCYSYDKSFITQYEKKKNVKGSWWRDSRPYQSVEEAINAFEKYKEEQREESSK